LTPAASSNTTESTHSKFKRGKIVGHALKYAAESLGVRQVNLGVNTKNSPAVALYGKLGFVQYGIERGFLLVGGELHDEFQMVCVVRGVA
jgi:RimJ/RimL family protein N-acetyltransferase